MAMTEEQLRARILTSATQGALIKNWIKHPAFKLFEERLQQELTDAKNKWISGTKEEAEEARAEAKGIVKSLSILRSFINIGVVAKEKLKEEAEQAQI